MSESLSHAIGAKVRLRLISPLVAVMLFSILDRVNLSMGALKMNQALGLSPSEFGFAAGSFFIGYLIMQYPMLMLLERVQARLWFGLCAIAFGAASGGTAFLMDGTFLVPLRIILGIAEAGLAPGIVLYINRWTGEREQASNFAWPMLAVPVSISTGGAISGLLLDGSNPLGLDAWRWMFLAEAVPGMIAGLCLLLYLPNAPQDAAWLTDDEKQWLAGKSIFALKGGAQKNDAVRQAFLNPALWLAAMIWFLLLAGAYGIMFWLPLVLRGIGGLGSFEIGLIYSLPWIGLGLGIFGNSRHSDHTGERFWHMVLPCILAAVSFLAAPIAADPVIALVLLFLGGLGLGAAQGVFWTLPIRILPKGALTAGVAAVNVAGSVAGLVIPALIGILRECTGSFYIPILFASGLMAVAAVLAAAAHYSARAISDAVH